MNYLGFLSSFKLSRSTIVANLPEFTPVPNKTSLIAFQLPVLAWFRPDSDFWLPTSDLRLPILANKQVNILSCSLTRRQSDKAVRRQGDRAVKQQGRGIGWMRTPWISGKHKVVTELETTLYKPGPCPLKFRCRSQRPSRFDWRNITTSSSQSLQRSYGGIRCKDSTLVRVAFSNLQQSILVL